MFISKVLEKEHFPAIYDNLLQLSEEFELCSIFNSNEITSDKYSKYKWIIALDSISQISSNTLKSENYIDELQLFIDDNKNEWIFSALSYDLKNGIENLYSNNSDNLLFDDFHFFIPKFIIILDNKNELTLSYHSLVSNEELLGFKVKLEPIKNKKSICNHNIEAFTTRISKQDYINTIDSIRKDIKYGDIYEMNFCQEFYVESARIDNPWMIYEKMCKLSPAPFSAYYKNKDKHLISASPERYIQRTNYTIISQPIKGTARRINNEQEDQRIAKALQESIKERAENIMIVDLIRNDLSRIPKSKNTRVEELCEIYSFKYVHQMISTISAEINSKTKFTDIIKTTFPMGSMTGAPKISSMELIEKYEEIKRGLFSGSVGYIEPNGNFDFNVIIRSLLYNSTANYLSLSTGGAITYLCNAEDEYQESLLKAEAVFKLF